MDGNTGDRSYVAQSVGARTGLSKADAEKRVVAEAKAAADKARRGAARLSLWLTAALLFGAFAAALAAVEGALLDGMWKLRKALKIKVFFRRQFLRPLGSGSIAPSQQAKRKRPSAWEQPRPIQQGKKLSPRKVNP